MNPAVWIVPLQSRGRSRAARASRPEDRVHLAHDRAAAEGLELHQHRRRRPRSGRAPRTAAARRRASRPWRARRRRAAPGCPARCRRGPRSSPAPYSSAYETDAAGRGSLPALRIGTRPTPAAIATAPASRKPRASTPATTSNLPANGAIMASIEVRKAAASASSGVMSRNRTPGSRIVRDRPDQRLGAGEGGGHAAHPSRASTRSQRHDRTDDVSACTSLDDDLDDSRPTSPSAPTPCRPDPERSGGAPP